MNNLIYKTALITLAALAGLAVTVFAFWILISPQSMAGVCEKTGNYSFAVTCADLRYKYTGATADLARCAEDSVLCGKDKLIIKYGEKLIAAEGYAELCASKDKEFEENKGGEYIGMTGKDISYNTYIRAHLSAAQYRSGNLASAINTAKGGGAQAFTKLVIEIIENGTKDDAREVLNGLDGSDEKLIKLLNEFINR